MRWVMEVLKSALVGKALAYLLEEEKKPIPPPQMPSEQASSEGNNTATEAVQAPAQTTAVRNVPAAKN